MFTTCRQASRSPLPIFIFFIASTFDSNFAKRYSPPILNGQRVQDPFPNIYLAVDFASADRNLNMSFRAFIKNLGNAYTSRIVAGVIAGTATVTLDNKETSPSRRSLGHKLSTEKQSKMQHMTHAKAIIPHPNPAQLSNSLHMRIGFPDARYKQRHESVWVHANEATKGPIGHHTQQREKPGTSSPPSDPYDEAKWTLVPYRSGLLQLTPRSRRAFDIDFDFKSTYDSAFCHLQTVSLGHEEYLEAAEDGAFLQENDEWKVSLPQFLVGTPEMNELLITGDAEASEVEATEEDSDPSLSFDDNSPGTSTRIASTSTAATSNLAWEQIVEVEKELVATEQQFIIGQLQKSLKHEQDLSQSFRLQLVSREHETESLQKELKRAMARLAQYEEESDDNDVKICVLKRQLAAKEEVLVALKSKSAVTTQQLEHLRQHPVVIGDPELLAELDQSNQQTHYYYEQAVMLEKCAHAAAIARSNLEIQLKKQETEFQKFCTQCDENLDHAVDTISGLEQQLVHMAQLKDRAEGDVEELKQFVEALGRNLTADYVKDPTPVVNNPLTTRPDQLRDLQQAFEMSQKKCAEAAMVNQDLEQEVQRKTREVDYLRESLVAEKLSLARLYESLETYRSEFESADPDGKSRSLAQELDFVYRDNTNLEQQLLEIKHHHAAELEHMSKKITDLEEQNIKLDGENFKVHDLEAQLKNMQEQVGMLDGIANSWKNQCIHQAGGPTADVLANTFKEQAERHTHEREALMRRMCQFNAQVAVLEDDLVILRDWVSSNLAGVRALEAERDYNHALVIGLRERFAAELETKPFHIPWNPTFSTLTSDEERQQLSIEDALIAKVTGLNLRRAEEWSKAEQKKAAVGTPTAKGVMEEKPRGITAKEIWDGIAQAVNGTNGPTPKC
ncbi:hypothetical protein PV08_01221 [Exophiala spinifera]|uniref:Uncharacterized protein n=1 Tax=Exophiala spinifera TaxID=91928 RepID=A0A0D2CAN6_9EURO|nr:uncharacterized protein PV08_01221 [Exophiala spinifera]KIW20644.1 hypothetical protein PV08_01221 [Exophiala spinifera]